MDELREVKKELGMKDGTPTAAAVEVAAEKIANLPSRRQSEERVGSPTSFHPPEVVDEQEERVEDLPVAEHVVEVEVKQNEQEKELVDEVKAAKQCCACTVM
jgi:hypothetical protein